MKYFLSDFESLVEVRNSTIHGKGIFAINNIKSGSLILVIKGETISEDECIRREEEENNVYIFWNEDNYIDTSNTGKIKFINHDCSPNCEVEDRDTNSLNLIASQNISTGDELTIDYGYEEIYKDCSCSVCENKAG